MISFGLKLYEDLDIYQLDIGNAYVNADVKENIFLKAPEGFEHLTEQERRGFQTGELVQLLKSLYGLKQAGRNWNELFIDFLKKLNFEQSEMDPCLLYGTAKSMLGVLMLIIYVDDILCLSTKAGYQTLINETRKEFEVKELGLAEVFLGVEIYRGENYIELRQSKDIEKILTRFKMDACAYVDTPLGGNAPKEIQENPEADFTDITQYRSLVGCLQYIQVWTRLDISHSVGFLSRFLVSPTEINFKHAKRVLRYLKGSTAFSIKFYRAKKNKYFDPNRMLRGHIFILEGYSDSDWGNDLVKRRSTTGYLFTPFPNEVIAHCSVLQHIVTLSTFEAEYVALVDATKEGIWLSRLIEEILNHVLTPKDRNFKEYKVVLKMYTDNQGTKCFANQPKVSRRSKHIDIRKHWLYELTTKQLLIVKHIPSEKNLADFLTKILPGPTFWKNIVRVMQTYKREGEVYKIQTNFSSIMKKKNKRAKNQVYELEDGEIQL
jgi:hypothetical protein